VAGSCSLKDRKRTAEREAATQLCLAPSDIAVVRATVRRAVQSILREDA
jgi:hypothetical protein